MEHLLEMYIRRYLSPVRQQELERNIRNRLSDIDAEGVSLLDDVLKQLPYSITDANCLLWWKNTQKKDGFRNNVVRTLALRYNVDLDQPADKFPISLIRTIQAAQQPISYASGPTGCVGSTGPIGTAGQYCVGGICYNNDAGVFGVMGSTGACGATGPMW